MKSALQHSPCRGNPTSSSKPAAPAWPAAPSCPCTPPTHFRAAIHTATAEVKSGEMGTIYKRAGVKASGTSILLLSKSPVFRRSPALHTQPLSDSAPLCCHERLRWGCQGPQLARHSFPSRPCLPARAPKTTLQLNHTGPTPAPGEASPLLGFL